MAVKTEYDVIVVGGGVAGVVAAVQAAKAGASALLVERTSRLSGTAVASTINAIGLFHAFGKQVIGGIGWDWVVRTQAETHTPLPDFAAIDTTTNRHNVHVNLGVFALIADEMLAESGADLLLHAMPGKVVRENGVWQVDMCLKEGLARYQAKVLIDATGDSSLARMAGCPLWREPSPQPGTLTARLGGYDRAAVNWEALREAYREGEAQDLFIDNDFGWSGSSATEATPGERRCEGFFRNGGGNASHVESGDAATSAGRTLIEQRSLAWLRRTIRHFRKVPGLEKLRLDSLPPECGVRETDRIVGRTVVTDADYESGKIHPDAVCYSFYPVDIHLRDASGLTFRKLGEGVVPTIPLGAMLPKGVDGLIACGRCVSGERAAFSAYRTMATCMATGQAAGVVAALATQDDIPPEKVPQADWRRVLTQYGAILPPTV